MFGGFQLYRGSPLLGIISRWNWVQKDPKASVMNQWITLSKWSGWSFSLLNEEQTRWLLSTNQFIYNVFMQDDVSLLHVLFIAVLQWSWPRSSLCREAFQFRCDGVWTWVSRCDPRTRAVWTCPEQQGGTLKIFCCCFSPYLRKMDPFWLRFFNASGLKPSSRKNFCISRMAILVSICCILRVVFCNKVLFTRSSPKNFDEGTGKGCCSPDMLRI